MSNLPLRQLGGVGVNTDASAYDLPPNAFSACSNVIFSEGRVQRAPVFKALFPPIMSPLTYAQAVGTYAANPSVYEAAEGGSPANTRFVGCYTDPAAGETVFVCDNDGTVRGYPKGTLDIMSPVAGFVFKGVNAVANTGTGKIGVLTYAQPVSSTFSYQINISGLAGAQTYTGYTIAIPSGTPTAITGCTGAWTSGMTITLAPGRTVVISGAPSTTGSTDAFQLLPISTIVTNDNPWTHAQVAGVSYLARAGSLPYARNIKNDANYSIIGGDWVPSDTAAIVRPYMDFVIMMNLVRNGNPLPTVVKWNNPALYSSSLNQINWDPANPNYVSGENTLGEMRDPILDGATLGANFIIYSQNQMWAMQYTGAQSVFNFTRIPYEGGIINANCVVEVDSKHYVFGDNDIYVHDGMSKLSLAEGRVRRRIFNTIDRSKQNSFFVLHDSVSKLIHFCYATLQSEASFYGVTGCNQAAIYNYKNDTWSFMDLPNILGGTESNASLVQTTWPQQAESYGLINTPYTSFAGGGTPRICTMLGAASPSWGLTASRVYAVDLPSNGIVNLAANTECLKPAYVERTGLSLDSTGASLRSYKLVQSCVPEAFFDDTTGTFTFQFGSSDRPEQSPNYRSSATYDPNTDYKIDMMVAGRFLAYKISTSAISNFQISGMDCEIKPMSRR